MKRTILILAMAMIGVLLPSRADAQDVNEINTPDSTGVVGWSTSIALTSAGNPVVSYYRWDTGDLKLLICGDPACSSGNTVVSAITGGTVGVFSSLVLDSSDNAIVAFYDQTNGDLRLLICLDPLCSTGTTVTVDSTGDVGWNVSMVIDSAGNPVISYRDVTNNDLKVARCDNPVCSSVTIATPDSAGDVGWGSSIKLNSIGNAVVSYRDNSNGNLKLLVCGNSACSSSNSVVTVDSDTNTGWYSSLELGPTDRATIAYFDFQNAEFQMVFCGSPTCAALNVYRTPDPGGLTGSHPSMAIDSSGNPIISYYDLGNNDLQVMSCPTTSCQASPAPVTTNPDTRPFVGRYTSMVLDASGYPVISYYDEDLDDLKILHCASANCVSTCNAQVATIDMVANGGDGTGTTGDDVITGSVGDDRINGSGGNDLICSAEGADVIRGGAGDDTILAGDGADEISGGGGADTIDGDAGADTIRGQGGQDVIDGGSGADTIDGNGAADDILGGSGPDTIDGQNGADTIDGGPSPDDIGGQTGPDTLSGAGGDDILTGGDGGDTLYGGAGIDRCAGNTGPDSAQASSCEMTPGVETLF